MFLAETSIQLVPDGTLLLHLLIVGIIAFLSCLAVVVMGSSRLTMIRKLKSGEYRLYSRKKNPKTSKRRNLGTFKSLSAAKKHERAVQFFKRHH